MRTSVVLLAVCLFASAFDNVRAQSLGELQSNAVQRKSAEERKQAAQEQTDERNETAFELFVVAAQQAIAKQGVVFESVENAVNKLNFTLRMANMEDRIGFLDDGHIIATMSNGWGMPEYYMMPKGADRPVGIHAMTGVRIGETECNFTLKITSGASDENHDFPCSTFASKSGKAGVLRVLENAVREDLKS